MRKFPGSHCRSLRFTVLHFVLLIVRYLGRAGAGTQGCLFENNREHNLARSVQRRIPNAAPVFKEKSSSAGAVAMASDSSGTISDGVQGMDFEALRAREQQIHTVPPEPVGERRTSLRRYNRLGASATTLGDPISVQLLWAIPRHPFLSSLPSGTVVTFRFFSPRVGTVLTCLHRAPPYSRRQHPDRLRRRCGLHLRAHVA